MKRKYFSALFAVLIALFSISSAVAATSVKPKTSVTVDGYVIRNLGLTEGPFGADMIGFSCKSVKASKWATPIVYNYLQRDIDPNTTYAIDDPGYCPPAGHFSFDEGAVLTVSP